MTEGAFRRASFLQPVLTGRPLPWLRLRAGWLAAWSTAPIGQAFMTYRAGGIPTNHLGEATSGYWLGQEIDWAVEFGDASYTAGSLSFTPQALLQGGHLLPSEDLAGAGAPPLHMIMASGRVSW